MAENIPSVPSGAVPPKKETGKVQPKKETVRINLPPKPSAAPTIKLPTLPPGGPAGAPAGCARPSPSRRRGARAKRASCHRRCACRTSCGGPRRPAPCASSHARCSHREHFGHHPRHCRSGDWVGGRGQYALPLAVLAEPLNAGWAGPTQDESWRQVRPRCCDHPHFV